jgi:tetratricopeptide (TPR) repeat protein
MKNSLEKIKQLCSSEQFDEALQELESLEKENSLSPNLLVLKATCIQLGKDESLYTLADAETTYKKALEIDPNHVDALNEIGYYYLNVLDKQDIARPYFDKAMSIARTQLSEAIRGMAECISETSPEEALSFIEQSVKNAVNPDIIQDTIRDIEKNI